MPPRVSEPRPDASEEGYHASEENGFLAAKPLIERVGQPARNGRAAPIHRFR